MMLSFLLQILLLYALLARAQTTLQIPLIPLAVKTPYLNAWYRNGPIAPAANWPKFFTYDNNKILGWVGMIRVDNNTYQWLGGTGINTTSTQTVMSTITPTNTVFRIAAGPIQFNLTFFSPIEPNDYVRQSIPFSYMYIDAFSANDSLPHDVQVYSDITAEWAAWDITIRVKWDTVEGDTMVYHHVTREVPQPQGWANDDFAEDSNVYYAAPKRSGFTWQTGGSVECRQTFSQNGAMKNSRDFNFREINADGWPTFSYAVDLGNISPGSQPDPVVWALGLVRDPLLTDPSINQNQTGYWWSAYSDISSLISAFLSDFKDSRDRNSALDARIVSAASATSPEYADILSIVTRQIFASMDITLGRTADGTLNPSDVRIYMKDMGQSRRTNPVDVLYGALPALLYHNPSIVHDLLKPLLELQTSSSHAASDLGTTYPTISTTTADTQTIAVDNCGSMLIMAYAHAIKSGDGSLISRYYRTLQSWADFLVANTMNLPSDSFDTDGLPGGRGANLVLKGVLGVYAMGKITKAIGYSDTSYMDSATRLAQNWTQLYVTPTHIKSAFNDSDSWGLIYNLFPAIWLNTSLISNDTLSRQGQFYMQQNGLQSGFALDTSLRGIAYTHWTLLTAATVPATDNLGTLRAQLIHQVHQRAYNNTPIFTLPMRYTISDGAAVSPGKSGSPIFGAAYGLLVLNLPDMGIRPDSIITPLGPSKKTGTIVGGVIGGIAGVILLGFVLVFWRRLKAQRENISRSQRYTYLRPFIPTSTSTPRGASRESNSRPRKQGLQTHPTVTSATPTSGHVVTPATSRQGKSSGPPVHSSAPSASATVSDSTSTNNAATSREEELRVEVAQLREEMESMRHLADLPPAYT